MALRLVLPLPAGGADEDRRTSILTDAAPDGWLEEGADAPPIQTPAGELGPPPEGHVRYTMYVGPKSVEDGVARLLELGPGVVVREPVDPDWRERWKLFFVPFAVSERLRVRPPWEAALPETGLAGGPAVEVVIDPGMAFGTGHHETTHLCLQALDELAAAGSLPSSLLDVGCGSGILSIAARLLGAARAVAVDIDPDSVAATRDNAVANGVSVAVSDTAVGRVQGTFPLVIANILASILDPLAEDIAARVAPGGRLMLSGALQEQAAALAARYEALHLRVVGRAERGRWVRLDLRRPA